MGLLLMEREAAYFLSPRGPVHVSLNDLGEMDGLRGRRSKATAGPTSLRGRLGPEPV